MNFRRNAILWALLPALLLAPPLAWLGSRLRQDASEALRDSVQDTLSLYAAAIVRSFDRIESKVESLAAFASSQIAADGKIDQGHFNLFAAGLHESAQWIRAFQVVSNGIITHTFPLRGNESVLGYDLLADPRPVLGGDVLRALETGRVTVTGPVELVQGGSGIIVRKAITKKGEEPGRLVAVVLNATPLLAESGIEAASSKNLQLAIRRVGGTVLFGLDSLFGQNPVQQRLSLPDGTWEMAACPVGGWPPSRNRQIIAFELAGTMIVLLVCALVYSFAYRQVNLEETVRARTQALQNEFVLKQQSQEQFRLIMENLADLVAVLDVQGHRLYNSPSYRHILGDPDLLLGTSSFAQVHPEDRVRVEEAFQETIRTAEGQRLQYRLVDQAGRARYIESQGSVIRDAQGRVSQVVVVSRDMTERQQAEETLRESETRYRFLFEQNPMPMLIYERGSFQMLAVNQAFVQDYGYTRSEALAMRLLDLYPVEEKDKIASLASGLQGHANVGEWRHRKRDGSYMTIVASSHDLTYDGRDARVAVMTDITERKRMEEALRHSEEKIREWNVTLERRVRERTAELAVAKDRAESADRLKSAFLATMSHELRTPLNSIIGFTGILLQGLAGPLNAEQSKQLGMVQGSARHLLALINDVLDISKIEAGQLEVRSEPFDLGQSVEKVVALVRPLAVKKSLQLRAELPAKLGIIVSDRVRVEQVLLNLLNNAVKFTDTGEVVLLAERRETEAPPGSSLQPPVAVLQVRDTGIGIKPEDMVKLFQPFRQIDVGLTRQHEGTGLGLAICRRLASMLGGEITARSVFGEGSTFSFHLPAQPKA